uniref:Uncharacterized protein n=1 Tax=Onchocerca volvulus TaxID=6282 RepID=A0A8R1TU47_ONCVO
MHLPKVAKNFEAAYLLQAMVVLFAQTPKNILELTKKENGVHPDEVITCFSTLYGRILIG